MTYHSFIRLFSALAVVLALFCIFSGLPACNRETATQRRPPVFVLQSTPLRLFPPAAETPLCMRSSNLTGSWRRLPGGNRPAASSLGRDDAARVFEHFLEALQ